MNLMVSTLRMYLSEQQAQLDRSCDLAISHIRNALVDSHQDDVAAVVAGLNARRAARNGAKVLRIQEAIKVALLADLLDTREMSQELNP